MNIPEPGDYIDIHTHEAKPVSGIFSIDNLMAHETRLPEELPGIAYTSGIHPWHLNELNYNQLIISVKKLTINDSVIGVGEAGFDRLKGPASELQRRAFEEQILLSEEIKKPMVIHCVRAWDELLQSFKKMKPAMKWLIHGFRGNEVLAAQLTGRGMFISIWFDFAIRPESAGLIRSIPHNRIFLETDGSGVDIREIYYKVSEDLGITVDELRLRIRNNFDEFFRQEGYKLHI